MDKKIKKILDGDIPDDVCHWIVEFREELDDHGLKLTPEQAASVAFMSIKRDPVALVTHVRSGLTWDVRIRDGKTEVTEVIVNGDERYAHR